MASVPSVPWDGASRLCSRASGGRRGSQACRWRTCSASAALRYCERLPWRGNAFSSGGRRSSSTKRGKPWQWIEPSRRRPTNTTCGAPTGSNGRRLPALRPRCRRCLRRRPAAHGGRGVAAAVVGQRVDGPRPRRRRRAPRLPPQRLPPGGGPQALVARAAVGALWLRLFPEAHRATGSRRWALRRARAPLAGRQRRRADGGGRRARPKRKAALRAPAVAAAAAGEDEARWRAASTSAEVVLGPGEALCVPPLTFHRVEALAPAGANCVSLNAFSDKNQADRAMVELGLPAAIARAASRAPPPPPLRAGCASWLPGSAAAAPRAAAAAAAALARAATAASPTASRACTRARRRARRPF